MGVGPQAQQCLKSRSNELFSYWQLRIKALCLVDFIGWLKIETNPQWYFEIYWGLGQNCASFWASLKTLANPTYNPCVPGSLSILYPISLPTWGANWFQGGPMLKSWISGLLRLTGCPEGHRRDCPGARILCGYCFGLPHSRDGIFYLSNIPSQWGLTFSNKSYQSLSFKAWLWVHAQLPLYQTGTPRASSCLLPLAGLSTSLIHNSSMNSITLPCSFAWTQDTVGFDLSYVNTKTQQVYRLLSL